MTTTPLPPTPRCDAEMYESGPTAANYGINDPDVVVDYTFAQQLERELIAATQARADLEAENKRLREALHRIDSIAVFLPAFDVIHEGGIEAVTQNIVKAISEAVSALEKQP